MASASTELEGMTAPTRTGAATQEQKKPTKSATVLVNMTLIPAW
jgi:hypothetical protein